MTDLSPSRRTVLGALLAMPAIAQAQDAGFPTRPVRIILPFAPGGSTDTMVRLVANRLSAMWRQPVLVESRPGAGTTLGAAFVAAAPPDGHVLYGLPGASHAIAGVLYHPLPYNPVDSFAGISLLATQPLVLANRPDTGPATLLELIAQARARPGALTFASTGIGASPHLAMEALMATAQVEMLHVPFTGSGPATTALLARHVDMAISDATILNLVRDGSLRALGVTTAERWPGLETVPTFAESGLPGYDITSWVGLFAPSATPPAVVERINRAVTTVLAEPEIERIFAASYFRASPTTPEATQDRLRQDVRLYGDLVRRLGLKRE